MGRVLGFPGWEGTARGERLVEEPGRPGAAERERIPARCRGSEAVSVPPMGAALLDVRREDITAVRLRRESERPVVARKRSNVRGAKGPC